MELPTATDNPRPIQPTDGMMRDYSKEINGVTHVFLEQYKDGQWVLITTMILD